MKKIIEKFEIKNKESFHKIIFQFIKFGIVGASNTIIFLIIYYLFIYINNHLYIIGNTVGFIVSVLNAYYWNSKYVFKIKNTKNRTPLIKTFVSYGMTFALSTLFLYIMVNYFNISEKIAPIINLLITIPLNFLMNKYWAFKEKK